jgi:hypothetical protein
VLVAAYQIVQGSLRQAFLLPGKKHMAALAINYQPMTTILLYGLLRHLVGPFGWP